MTKEDVIKQIVLMKRVSIKYTVSVMAVFLFLLAQSARAQVTIGSGLPPVKGALLDLKEKDDQNGGKTSSKGILFPRVNLEGLQTLRPVIPDSDPDIEQLKKSHTGMVVYNLTVDPERNLLKGLYAWMGTYWRKTSRDVPESDAIRFLGGTVFVRLKSTSNPRISSDRVINNGSGRYTMGNDSQANTAGGVTQLKGQGYKISNYANGYFNIVFDVPFSEIYGVSTNILDVYVSGGIIDAGLAPTPENPGQRLDTRDNSQITYMDNSCIRVKTGDSSGTASNRTFTFVIIGR